MIACADCGHTVEATGGWSKPSGTAGTATAFSQAVQPAPVVLGRDGYLCTRDWWRRVKELPPDDSRRPERAPK